MGRRCLRGRADRDRASRPGLRGGHREGRRPDGRAGRSPRVARGPGWAGALACHARHGTVHRGGGGMKAINLLPRDARRSFGAVRGVSGGTFIVLGALATALVLVLTYVLLVNDVR